jgi:hypothetical protein
LLKSKIENYYEKHDCERICQGDILKDFSFALPRLKPNNDIELTQIIFPYIIILSQDCDLESGTKELIVGNSGDPIQCNQFLHNVMFTPAFPAEMARDGKHLVDLFNVKQARLDSDLWKRIIQNKDERYHFLKEYLNYQVPALLSDFKAYYTVPKEYILSKYKTSYVATVNELFRELLSQRFANYLSRIGTPELPTTGDVCQTAGTYKVINHVQHPGQINMDKGKQFPPCSECGTKVQYQLVQATQH